MDASNVGDFLRQSTVSSTVHSFMRGRQDDPRTLLFFQVTVAASEHGEENNTETDDKSNSSSKDASSNNNSHSINKVNESKHRQNPNKLPSTTTATTKTNSGSTTNRKKLVFTTGKVFSHRNLIKKFLIFQTSVMYS